MAINSVSLNGTLQSAYTLVEVHHYIQQKCLLIQRQGLVLSVGLAMVVLRLFHMDLMKNQDFHFEKFECFSCVGFYHEQYMTYPNTGNYYGLNLMVDTLIDNAMFNSDPTVDLFTIGSCDM